MKNMQAVTTANKEKFKGRRYTTLHSSKAIYTGLEKSIHVICLSTDTIETENTSR
jgi:hypothetical protein